MKQFFLTSSLILVASSAQSQDMVKYSAPDSFDNVAFAVESAIVGQGLVIDHVSYVGDMLERTREDVGSDKVLFSNANVYSFCSASVSRKVMEADPMNIAFCPYNIFVAELPDAPGEVLVGFRKYPDGPMQEVQALLDGIVQEAIAD